MDNLNDFKIMLTAGIAAVMGLLGWQGVLLVGWVPPGSYLVLPGNGPGGCCAWY